MSEREKMIKALEAYEKWEASLLGSDGPWVDEMPDDLYDALCECQKLRNEALKEHRSAL